uniref:Origin recognition complex subunit 1 n=1 Tax=Podarcis muralis TaxID=64176 RepID=A0A670I8D3_PODMU
MNTRNQKKRIYSWLGKAIAEDKQLQLSSYRGIAVKSKNVSDTCIFPGEFILIEGENVDQFLVARLLKLYEDGTHEKRAVVEWFSRLLEIPLSQRKSMGREDPQEIFLNENPERDTDITVTHIIGNVTVIPLTTLEALPDLSNDEHIFFVRESWDGKKFKPLPLSVLAELKDSVKMKNNNADFANVHHLTPSRRNCSLEVETEKVTRSTRKSSAAMMEVESRHSASKSSHSKQRCSQRLAIGTETPGAKKKLQLNSMFTNDLAHNIFVCKNIVSSGSPRISHTMFKQTNNLLLPCLTNSLSLVANLSPSLLFWDLNIFKCLVYTNFETSCALADIQNNSTDIYGYEFSLQPEPRTPKTPRNATPRIRSRNQTTQKPGNVLEEARIRLHVSAVPESLPCREKEFQDIYNFIESKLIDGTGGCMYISGVPGTGKTATVHEVIRCLEKAAENNELPSFQCIEINGMKLTDPHQAYVQILNLLTGQKATAVHAAELLEKTFCKRGPKRKTVILVVDELDLLWTRKQNVMYNLFDWPTKKDAKLIVLAIANTMDLPERIMMNRVASRLGLTRMSFQPYTYKQLQQIVSSRMTHLKAFEEDAIQLVSRKVAALSGDARRCLDICRRAAEICELPGQKSVRGLVSMAHIMEAIDEMFSSPYIHAIRNASLYEQIFLKATIAEFRRSGLEESTVQQIFHQHVALCRIEGLQTPTVSDALAVVSRLSAYRLLLTDFNSKYIHMRVRLNVSQDDIMYALKED